MILFFLPQIRSVWKMVLLKHFAEELNPYLNALTIFSTLFTANFAYPICEKKARPPPPPLIYLFFYKAYEEVINVFG